jgi:hypothetical protein
MKLTPWVLVVKMSWMSSTSAMWSSITFVISSSTFSGSAPGR